MRQVAVGRTRVKWVVEASAAAKWLAPEVESAQADATDLHARVSWLAAMPA